MTITNPIGRLRPQSAPTTSGPPLVFVAALATAVAAAAVLDQSKEQMVPATSALLFLLAAVVALIAWLRSVPSRHLTYWDVAGGLTFIGICLAATVEPEQMVRLVAGAEPNP
jgi:hypothetical protein